jgi:hypothetical protein
MPGRTMIEGNDAAGNARKCTRPKELKPPERDFESSDAGNHRPGGK